MQQISFFLSFFLKKDWLLSASVMSISEDSLKQDQITLERFCFFYQAWKKLQYLSRRLIYSNREMWVALIRFLTWLTKTWISIKYWIGGCLELILHHEHHLILPCHLHLIHGTEWTVVCALKSEQWTHYCSLVLFLLLCLQEWASSTEPPPMPLVNHSFAVSHHLQSLWCRVVMQRVILFPQTFVL